jgi:hypothetical protein
VRTHCSQCEIAECPTLILSSCECGVWFAKTCKKRKRIEEVAKTFIDSASDSGEETRHIRKKMKSSVNGDIVAAFKNVRCPPGEKSVIESTSSTCSNGLLFTSDMLPFGRSISDDDTPEWDAVAVVDGDPSPGLDLNIGIDFNDDWQRFGLNADDLLDFGKISVNADDMDGMFNDNSQYEPWNIDTADIDTADIDTADIDTADIDTADIDTADFDKLLVFDTSLFSMSTK